MSFIWPVTLPQSPLLSTYKESVKDTSIRSGMSYGPDKTRNLVSGTIINVTLRMLMSKTQTVALDTFYLGDIKRVAAFDWKHHRTGNAAIYRFTAPPEYIPVGLKFYVDLKLEILPASFDSAYSGAFA